MSIDQLLTTAAAEKISALTTEEYLKERASRGRRSKLEAVLKKAPSRQPVEGDEPS